MEPPSTSDRRRLHTTPAHSTQNPDNAFAASAAFTRKSYLETSVGDGLNTAGYRWVRRVSGTDATAGNGVNVNRDQFNVRIDHNFNSRHKLSLMGTREKDWSVVNPTMWPNGFNGAINRLPDVYNLSFVSTLSPSVVNEFRAGRRRSIQWFWSAMTINGPDGKLRKAPKTMKPTEEGKEAFALVPKSNGIPYLPKTTIFPEHYIVTTTSRAGAQSVR